MRPDFFWWKQVWFANVSVFKWDLKFGLKSPDFERQTSKLVALMFFPTIGNQIFEESWGQFHKLVCVLSRTIPTLLLVKLYIGLI